MLCLKYNKEKLCAHSGGKMKIEIMKTFKESFKNVRENKLEWMRVATGPVLVYIFGILFMAFTYWTSGLLTLEAMTQQRSLMDLPFMALLGNVVYYLAYLMAVVSVIINGFRYAALKEGGDRWWTLNLNWWFVKTIFYYVLIILLLAIYAGVAVGIVLGANALAESTALNVTLAILFFIGLIYVAFRLGLIFFLIATDQTKPIRVSWALLKGNVLRFVGLTFLIMLAVVLISIAGVVVLGLLGWVLSYISNWLIAVIGLALIIFTVIMWLFSWAMTSKALSLVYKTLK